MPPRPHLAVKLAQKATPDDLLSKLKQSYGASAGKGKRVEVEFRDRRASLAVSATKTLSAAEKTWVWDLFERNMRSLYEESEDGYEAAEKRKELFHADSRFLVLYPSNTVGSSPKTPPKPLGYCIFRFDTEDTASEDDELCDVAYCYELQVDSAAQRSGVGQVLMDALERLGKAYRMDKVMLTVFKANASAVAFYSKIGFTTDEVDPSLYGQPEVDYSILSKACA
ncbi:hypothetical protein JCM10207_002293 [Rhodosporidiobolus poonsookiae]